MVKFNQITLKASTFLAMMSYVSAFWWPAEEPIKQSNARASSPTTYPQTSYPQNSYPGTSFAVSQGYPNNGFSGQAFSSQNTWPGAWPNRLFYDYNQATSLQSVPFLPMQMPMQAGFGSAHVQNVQLVPCLCPVTTEYGYDPAPQAQSGPSSTPTEGDKPHSRKMFGRSQQMLSPVVKVANNNAEETR